MNPEPFMLYTGNGFRQTRGHIFREYKLAIMRDQVDWRMNWSIIDLPTGCHVATGYATLQDAIRVRTACRIAYQQELEEMRKLASILFDE